MISTHFLLAATAQTTLMTTEVSTAYNSPGTSKPSTNWPQAYSRPTSITMPNRPSVRQPSGALISRSIVTMEEIAFQDLGCESVKRLEVKDLPLIVAVDAYGNNIFHRD